MTCFWISAKAGVGPELGPGFPESRVDVRSMRNLLDLRAAWYAQKVAT